MKNWPQRSNLLIGVFVVILIFSLSFLFFFTHFKDDSVHPPYRNYLAWIFLFYGGFRTWRIYDQFQRIKRDEEEQ